jgi:hypothetical protein
MYFKCQFVSRPYCWQLFDFKPGFYPGMFFGETPLQNQKFPPPRKFSGWSKKLFNLFPIKYQKSKLFFRTWDLLNGSFQKCAASRRKSKKILEMLFNAKSAYITVIHIGLGVLRRPFGPSINTKVNCVCTKLSAIRRGRGARAAPP